MIVLFHPGDLEGGELMFILILLIAFLLILTLLIVWLIWVVIEIRNYHKGKEAAKLESSKD